MPEEAGSIPKASPELEVLHHLLKGVNEGLEKQYGFPRLTLAELQDVYNRLEEIDSDYSDIDSQLPSKL